MSDTHSKIDLSACCGSCQNTNAARPRYVVGVFADLDGAHGAAQTLRKSTGGNVNVLSGCSSLMEPDQPDFLELSLMRCGRLFQQITGHLQSGAAIVVVHARSHEQQLESSRVLLDAKCDTLLTQDGARHAHAD